MNITKILRDIMDFVFWGNPVRLYLYSVVIFIVGYIIAKILLKYIPIIFSKAFERTKNKVFSLVGFIFRRSRLFFYIFIFYGSTSFLTIGGKVKTVYSSSLKAFVALYITYIVLVIIDWVIEDYSTSQVRTAIQNSSLQAIMKVCKILVFIFGFLLILKSLFPDFNISAILTGLGIGGLAVALAVQSIVRDIFNYFAIIFDKPFEEGDFIIFGNYLGTVEHIGLRSTRVRSLSGEEIVVPNTSLTSEKINNFKTLEKRRVLFVVSVIYETELSKLKEIPGIIEKIIKSIDDTIFDRAHFRSFGSFSLDYEAVYYVVGGDYNQYMDIQQKINLKIFEEFTKRNIEFAYPTQVVYLPDNKTKE